MASRATSDISAKASDIFDKMSNSVQFLRAWKSVQDDGAEAVQKPSKFADMFTDEAVLSGAQLPELPLPDFKPDEILQLLNPRKARVDFALESGLMEQYLSSLAAHFVYWSDQDTAVFVLGEIFEFSRH